MLDIGWSELAVIAVVALIVIGPKDLPKALYTVGRWVRSARKVAGEFQRHVDDMMREAELEDLKKNLQQARDFNIEKQIENTIDPQGELKGAFDPKVDPAATGKPGWTKPDQDLPPRKPLVPPGVASPVASPAVPEPPPSSAAAAVPPVAPPPAAAPVPPRSEAVHAEGAEERRPAPQGSDQTARG